MDINNKRFDLDYKLNDNESKCYPGQRRPKLKVNKGNLNINDIYSEYDFISKIKNYQKIIVRATI